MDVPVGSPKVALFPRNGGFLFPERWLRQNGNLAFFRRIMHQTPSDALTSFRPPAHPLTAPTMMPFTKYRWMKG